MKSNLYKFAASLIIAAVAITSVGIANAEEVSAVDGAFSASASVPAPAAKPPLRATLKANIENRIEANGEARNAMLEKRQEIRGEASTTIKQIRLDGRAEIKNMRASTTDMFKRAKNMRMEIKSKMEAKTYAIRKDALVKQLTLSLSNITDVSVRINSRIVKAQTDGKTVTDAQALFATASDKLTKAKADVAAFQALNLTASTTAEVDLAKPRVAGDAAIKSVKDARDAFQKVIVALAHDLGEKLPPPPAASATVNVTASTSAATN